MARPRPAHAATFWQGEPKTLPTAAQSSVASTPAAKPSAARQQSSAQPAASASTSSYIDSMKAAGLPDLTVDELIAMKIQDVTPEYVKDLHAQGSNPDANALIAMRVQDITPEYVRDLRAAGLNPTRIN